MISSDWDLILPPKNYLGLLSQACGPSGLGTYLCVFVLTVCNDCMRTSTCKYLISVYRQKSVDCCKWKSMKTHCAQTCKHCGRWKYPWCKSHDKLKRKYTREKGSGRLGVSVKACASRGKRATWIKGERNGKISRWVAKCERLIGKI